MKKSSVLFEVSMKNLKTLKYSKKKIVLSITCSKCGSKDEKIFKEEELIKILKSINK